MYIWIIRIFPPGYALENVFTIASLDLMPEE